MSWDMIVHERLSSHKNCSRERGKHEDTMVRQHHDTVDKYGSGKYIERCPSEEG